MASDQLEGYVPPEEDKVTIAPRLGSIPGRAPEIREDLNNWKQRFDYALAVMAGSQPAEWLDQLGAREIVSEAGFEGAQYAIPSVKPFPRTVMRPGAIAVHPSLVPFARPFEGAVPKEMFKKPEAANVNVDVKTGWDEVLYKNPNTGKEDIHHFLYDTEGRPAALVTPSPPGVREYNPGRADWFINFLDPNFSKGDAYKFVGESYALGNFKNAKDFAMDAIKEGKFATKVKPGEFTTDVMPTYGKYFDKESRALEAEARRAEMKGEPPPAPKEGGQIPTDPYQQALTDQQWDRMRNMGSEGLVKRIRSKFEAIEGGKGKEPELVTAAVIETPDGKRLRGYSHFDAMTKNWDEYIKHDAEKMKGSLFETSTGRLINKDEALALMDKTGQKRLGLSTKETGLMSEDVPELIGRENERVMRDMGIDPNAPHPFYPPDEPLKFSSPFDRKQTQQFYNFVTELSGRVDPEKWKRFIEAQPLSENIEDRRNEPYLAKRGEQELYQDLLEESFRQLREQDILSMRPIPPLKREAEAR